MPGTGLWQCHKNSKNKVARHRIELRTAWMPTKQKYMCYQLSYCSIITYGEHTFLKGFLILLEPKIFVPDMTPEPLLWRCLTSLLLHTVIDKGIDQLSIYITPQQSQRDGDSHRSICTLSTPFHLKYGERSLHSVCLEIDFQRLIPERHPCP